MAKIIIMPRQGISVESCIITKWHKAVGDAVKPGDPLFSYETDKAAFDEEAQDEGVLLHRFHEEGDDVPCLTPVCVVGAAGEDITALTGGTVRSETQAGVPAPAPAPVPEPPSAGSVPPASSAPTAAAPGKASPRARTQARLLGVDIADAVPTGPDGRVIERDVLALHRAGAASTRAAAGAPAAQIAATGIGGRVNLADRAGVSAPPPSPAPVPAPAPATPAPAPSDMGEYEDKPMPQIRRAIARAMQASLSQMAQLTHHSSFDATAILAFRERIKSQAEALGTPNITIGDMICYAVSRVLLRHPDLNAHLLDNTMRRFKNVNLGVAVDTDRGLLVPTVFGADRLSLSEIAAQTKSLADACRGGSVSPDALRGGTFTVSNLGTLGVELFTPVINPPQTGILGVCNIAYRPRRGRDGAFEFYPALGLSLTYDHRALDGAPASRFLRDLCQSLENFDVLLSL